MLREVRTSTTNQTEDPARLLEIEDELVRLEEQVNAATRDQLRAIVRLDRAGAWRRDGVTSMASWLSYRFGLSEPTARERVEVAHALEDLPRIGDAFASGEFSWDQLRWLVRFATPDDDQVLAREAPGWHTAVLRSRAMQARRISRQEADRTQGHRSLRSRWNEQEGSLHIWGRIPGAEGELVQKTLERIREQISRPDPESGIYPLYEQTMADALVEVCSLWAGADGDPDRANIVCHISLESLISMSSNGVLESGVAIASESVRRVACDARLQALVIGPHGEPLGIGRATRTVPAWLTRELRRRDVGCRYPGCGRTRALHAHHVRHWADGGPTNEDNLILLCRFHHRLLHEGGFRLFLTPSGKGRFVRPDGRPLASKPAPLRPPSIRSASRPRSPNRQADRGPNVVRASRE